MAILRDISELRVDELITLAQKGNKDVLEEIVRRIQDRIYGMALRMLYIPADAEDAAQEIVTKVIIHLGGFKGKSSFDTWVFKIAVNHLLTMRKSKAEQWGTTFDICAHAVEEELPNSGYAASGDAEQNLIAEETKRSCLMFLMLCLKRKTRIAVILGEIMGVDSVDGGRILGIKPAAFRQQLSRGCRQITQFMAQYCGLVDTANPCCCEKLAVYHLNEKHINPKRLFFATHPCRFRQGDLAEKLSDEMDKLERAAIVVRNHPDYTAPDTFVNSMRNLISSNTFRLFG